MKKILALLVLATNVSMAASVSELIEMPSLGGGVLISSESNQDGVCKAFGFSHAAVGASRTGDYESLEKQGENSKAETYSPISISINVDGMISGSEVIGNSGYLLLNIICISKNENTNPKKVANTKKFSGVYFKTFRVLNPVHQNSGASFNYSTSIHGACLNLGYNGGAGTGYTSSNKTNISAVITSEDGSINSGTSSSNEILL